MQVTFLCAQLIFVGASLIDEDITQMKGEGEYAEYSVKTITLLKAS